MKTLLNYFTGKIIRQIPHNLHQDNFLFVSKTGFFFLDFPWSAFGKHENSSVLKNCVSTSWKSILELGNVYIFSHISQKDRLQWCQKLEGFAWEDFCHPVTLEWFSIQVLVNFFQNFQTAMKSLSITWLKSPFDF